MKSYDVKITLTNGEKCEFTTMARDENHAVLLVLEYSPHLDDKKKKGLMCHLIEVSPVNG